jgi:ribonuclease E
LAGLVVVDFIDMEESANNHAVEKRMKEAMKHDRARVQIAKMSMFGLLEISRQRLHSSLMESNYVTCPHCKGLGIQRTSESSAAFTLRAIEEECIKGLYESVEFKLPTDIALYVLNNKREKLAKLEAKYDIRIVISADSSICNVADLKVERVRKAKPKTEQVALTTAYAQEQISVANENDYDEEDEADVEETADAEVVSIEAEKEHHHKRHFDRRSKYGRRGRRYNNNDRDAEVQPKAEEPVVVEEKVEEPAPKEKKTWWKKLIG